MKHQTHINAGARQGAACTLRDKTAPDKSPPEKRKNLQAAGAEPAPAESLPMQGFSTRYIDSRLKQFCLR